MKLKYPINKTLKDITDSRQHVFIQDEIDKIYAEFILSDFPTSERIFQSKPDSWQTIKVEKNKFRSNIALDLCAHTIHVLTIKYKSFGHPQEWNYYILPNSLLVDDGDYLTEICLDCLLGYFTP